MTLLTSGGIRKGELYIISTPSKTGKSLYYDLESYIQPPKMKEPKYKFSRANWYEVTFTAFTLYGIVRERVEWCEQHFGKHPEKPDAWSRWYSTRTSIRFRDSKDYEWYMLRWS